MVERDGDSYRYSLRAESSRKSETTAIPAAIGIALKAVRRIQ